MHPAAVYITDITYFFLMTQVSQGTLTTPCVWSVIVMPRVLTGLAALPTSDNSLQACLKLCLYDFQTETALSNCLSAHSYIPPARLHAAPMPKKLDKSKLCDM
jgi:hypothetical protein